MNFFNILFNQQFGHRGDLIEQLFAAATGGGGGTATTVTGTAPLTLANALAKAIKKLLQFGKTEQASTPTPSVPVDIACNNGTLKMVDNELPVGYKRVTDIKFDGIFYYDTDEYLYGSDVIQMTLKDTTTTGQNVFGAYSGTGDDKANFSLYIYGGTSTGQSYLRYGDTLYRPRLGSGQRTITFGAGGTKGFLNNVTITEEQFTTTDKAYIGSLPNSTSPKFTGTIVGSILVGERMKFIPCEREADGVVGYYNTKAQAFLEPQGEGTPTKGAYDYSESHLEAVGTPEVLSLIQNQNTDPTIVKVTLSSGATEVRYNGSSSCIVAPVKPNTVYTIGFLEKPTSGSIFRVVTTKSQVSSSVQSVASIAYHLDMNDYEPKTINSGAEAAWIYVQLSNTQSEETFASIVIQEGNAIKLPQTANAQNLLAVGDDKDTQDIITGAVTRKVGVKVFDGTETFSKSTAYGKAFLVNAAYAAWGADRAKAVLCTHFLGLPPKSSTQDDNTCFFNPTGHFYFRVTDNSDIDVWKAWLADQYAAGTPVIVLYVLAEETTESVTPQPLNTFAGDNIVSVEANVSPIELEVEYMARS